MHIDGRMGLAFLTPGSQPVGYIGIYKHRPDRGAFAAGFFLGLRHLLFALKPSAPWLVRLLIELLGKARQDLIDPNVTQANKTVNQHVANAGKTDTEDPAPQPPV